MSKVITFSRTFPKYHPKAGQPTFFVEKILNSLFPRWDEAQNFKMFSSVNGIDYNRFYQSLNKSKVGLKHHTIRSGHRFKVGDKFSPRVWSGKPYNSKQIIIMPDIEVKETFDFDIDMLGGEYRLNGFKIHIEKLRLIALNDGFTELDDFELWFNVKRGKGFLGQIICWNENIEY